MSDETPIPSNNTPTTGQDVTNNPEQVHVGIQKMLGEAAKYTVFALFILYSVGFIIWQSFLASYGLSFSNILQIQYIAAAFCYLTFLVAFSFPPVLLYQAFKTNIRAKGLIKIKQWDGNLVLVTSIWFYLSIQVSNVLLPGTIATSKTGSVLINWLIIIAAIHLLSCVVFFSLVIKRDKNIKEMFTKGKFAQHIEGQWNWRETWFYKYLLNAEYLTIYLLAFILIPLFYNNRIPTIFWADSVFLFALISFGFIRNPAEHWRKGGALIRSLIASSICLLFVSHVQLFAYNVFGLIPRSIGGGKPEMAFIQFGSNYLHIAASMNLPLSPHSTPANPVFGPIGLIVRSDKELCFVNYQEMMGTVIITIQTPVITTNPFPPHTISTNIVQTFVTNSVLNDIKLSARQIRADEIDAIKFTKE